MKKEASQSFDIRQQLRQAVDHLEHVLPGQAPIKDFVHHNTLHGYQQLPFQEALAQAESLTGARGYLPEASYRAFYREGRITRDDLLQALDRDPELKSAQTVFSNDRGVLRRSDIYLAALVNQIKPISGCQLSWQMEERLAGERFQSDVDPDCRQQTLDSAAELGVRGEAAALADLWAGCLQVLGLEHYILHPEELVDLSPQQAEQMLEALEEGQKDSEGRLVRQLMIKEADRELDRLLERLGSEFTLRGLLLRLSGRDLLEELRPMLIRQLANHLDQGLAAWRGGEREQGFYQAWRKMAAVDLAWLFEDLPDWGDNLEFLPEDPLEAIIVELHLIGLPQSRWVGYLEQLAVELPGWSGMVLWRQQHPGYAGEKARVALMDFLAVRLVLERIFAQRLAREEWQIEPSVDGIRWHFHHYRAEFLVRYALFNLHLPEYLTHRAQQLVDQAGGRLERDEHWVPLAHLIWTWWQSPAADRQPGYTVSRDAWRLFRLAQHLGLCGAQIKGLDQGQLELVFDSLQQLTPGRRGFIWLQAYENNYLDQLLNALAENHQRQSGGSIQGEVQAQLVFCMDDREEGYRRHIEEINPLLETLGAAAHFGVPNYWRGVDDSQVTPLCPVVVTPSHEIREVPREGLEEQQSRHLKRRGQRFGLGDLLHQESRRNLFTTLLLILLAAPGGLVNLLGKVFAPFRFGRMAQRLIRGFEQPVETRVAVCAEAGGEAPTPEHPQLGFTDREQLDRVQTFLQNIGLVEGFAPLVVIMAHGSDSQNNPHIAAYNCGACSGRHSGPNARIFAAIANRPETRGALAERGIRIPDSTWFLGAEHNTCTEAVTWYDLDLLPELHREGFRSLCTDLDEAGLRHAHERCRRLASAPRQPTYRQALEHVTGRSTDFSQARPELGHATNAAAFVGRRSISKGTFFDRRVFLISYDCTTDPSGEVLERLLLANAPVGAGINLEYYFSTVDNERYGCGSKVTHNIAGLLGVMHGTNGDLSTGLPKQMIEIHEAMRLQVVVEASLETLAGIYGRQPELQELIGNGWLLLSAMDPNSGEISLFQPERGFVPWQGRRYPLERVAVSREWYRGHQDPLPPALIGQGV